MTIERSDADAAGARRPTTSASALRVYWEDTDAGGIVFYANYLKFFERARTEWLRAPAFRSSSCATEPALMFVVADTGVRYLQPARLDDLIDVTVRRSHGGRVGMQLAQQAWQVGADGAATRCSPKARSASAASTPEPSGRAAFPPI